MRPNDAEGIANSVDPDQTAPLGAVWSGSALFAKAYVSENLGSLRYSFPRNLGQTDTGVENDCDKKTASKNFEFLGFCKRTINHQSNDSLAFQQHASGQFSAIKPCLGAFLTCKHTHPCVTLQMEWDFCYVKFTGQLSSNLCNKASIIFSHWMLLKLSCLNTWLSADCHIIFIALTILLLQTQIKVIPIKFWVVYI